MGLVRYAVLLLVIALMAPGAVGALASGGTSSGPGVRAVAGAPFAFNVAGIEFALQNGDNARPIGPNTRFAYGTRGVWAFWSWNDAKNSSRVNWVLRTGNTDVNWGTLNTDNRDGRMEVLLERLDGERLDIGQYRLHLDAAGGDSGNVLSATFDIFDPDIGDEDNENDGDDDDDNENDDDDEDNVNDNN
jgi:hypothetical protein